MNLWVGLVEANQHQFIHRLFHKMKGYHGFGDGQCIKYLTYKHEDLSSYPQHPWKRWAW